MELELVEVEHPSGVVVEVERRPDGIVEWSVANATASPQSIHRVGLRFALGSTGEVRVFRHGWQSWSPSDMAVVGRDQDHSRGDCIEFQRMLHHADDAVAEPDELRSELVTLLADDDDLVCVGADGGDRHDTTFRVRPGHVVVEAYLGGAVLAPDERRRLHTVRIATGDDHSVLLEDWASWAGGESGARTDADHVAGWCSWYQYFHEIDEAALRANLSMARDWPIDVFQLDDGFQSAIGDWTTTTERFPSALPDLAADIAAGGMTPGLWLAPFLVGPTSRLGAEHPEWLAERSPGEPLIGMLHGEWEGHVMSTLDPTHPGAADHLEALARELVAMGWRHLKLDFTFAPSFPGRWHDPSATPAQRVRAGFDAIRRGAGDDAFLLGCGAPLGACIGVVDGMRIGPDVGPRWQPVERDAYRHTYPSTANAHRATLARAFQHRRLWLNDPDCVMLRTTSTELTAGQADAWAETVALTGGLTLLSDDLGLLDERALARFTDVVEGSRSADDHARAATTSRCPDLLDDGPPTTLTLGDRATSIDPVHGHLVTSPALPRD